MVRKYLFVRLIAFCILFFSFSFASFGQCAGDDASKEVCDISDPNNKTISLFSLLGPNAVAGGTWTDDDFSAGLNTSTGVLNAQAITSSGIYNYTYTVPGGCADTSATITVTIGGYSGITSPTASTCSDNPAFNLFQVFDGKFASPQSNGTWFNDTLGTPVTGSTVSPYLLGEGTFQFTYSIPAIGNCLAVSSVGFVSIFKAPEPGTPSKLLLCSNADFTTYTNFDLNDLLAGEDIGGIWTDDSGTGQITALKDRIVDVQSLYNNFGAGEYFYTYTILASNPVCEEKKATVSIRIEELLDFAGSTLVINSDICEDEIATATYSATLTKGPAPIPDGDYNVTYTVSGPSGETRTDYMIMSGGVILFPLASSYFQQVGNFTVEVTDITAVGSEGACINPVVNLSDILYINPTPDLTGASITIDAVCQNSTALVQITNASSLADGTYSIVYNLTGANAITSQTAQITVVGGISDFVIPSNFTVNEGDTVVTIEQITNTNTTCNATADVSGTLTVNPLPTALNLGVVVADSCFGAAVSASVSGLASLTNVEIMYTLSGSNIATETVSLVATSGNATFVIPSNLLPNTGSTTITVTNLVNGVTTCGVVVSSASDSFSIIAIPVPPTVTPQQDFCKSDGATIANLIPVGTKYQWFDSATSTTPLASSVVLVSKNYYVREITSTNSCLSDASVVSVVINDSSAPILNPNGALFCGINNPTIASLSANTNMPSTVVWYDSPTNGNFLNSTTLLQDKKAYYGFDFSSVTRCFSSNYLKVTVSLTNCTSPPVDPTDPTDPENPDTDTDYVFFVPDGFSPNGDGVNDAFVIPEIEFLYPDYRIEIYNRYGGLMFEGSVNKSNWDGRYSAAMGLGDSMAPNGVYFYIINFNKDNKSPQQGRLYLNR